MTMTNKLTYEDLERKYKELRNRSSFQKLPLDSSQWCNLLSSRALDSLPAGVAILDQNFTLRDQNRTYADYLRIYSPVGPEKALGMCYFDYMPGSRPQLEQWFRETRDDNRLETQYDFKLWLKYDTTKESTYWDASVVPLLGPARKVTGIVIFCLDVTNRHQALETIKRKQTELEVLGKKLEDSKACIRVLLDMEAQTRKRSEEKLSLNVNNLVLPLVARMKSSCLNKEQRAILDLIESTLTDITSGFSHELSSPALGLTPREILAAGLIKAGKTSKEIAAMLRVSPASIEFHRGNIRKKLGLTHKKRNLRSYLSGR